MCNDIGKLPDYELEFPLLDIFLIQENGLSTIPDKFILGVKEARVLDLGFNKIVSLPPSLKQLTKLCMLNLGGNISLHDISILGDLKSLEILILSHTRIVEIPQEIGYLVNLRRLVVKGCPRLSRIAPSVMSNLRWLEELHIAYYPVEDGNNESLAAIGKLSMLTFLDLFVPHIHLIPKGVCLTKLKGFVIQIGGQRPIHEGEEIVHKKSLILGMKDLDTPSMLQIKELIELSDGIIFDSVENPNNIVPTMYCESLDGLTTIMLSRCHNLLSLVEYSRDWDTDVELGGENTKKQFFSKLEHLFLLSLSMLHVLWNCPDQYISLQNLVTLNISDCNKLVRLFSVNVARELVNLQTLTIEECSSLKEVIWDGDEGDIDMVVFRCLVKIELRYLEELKSFYAGMVILKYPSLVKVEIYGCNIMDKWGYNGTYDTPNLKLVNQSQKEKMAEVDLDLIRRAAFIFQMRAFKYWDQVKQVVGLKEWPLSYDFLESEEAKLCILLCSMYPEDFNIPLESLAYYGVSIEIFKDLDSMEDARNGVRHAVEILNQLACNNKFLVKTGKDLKEWQPRTKSVKSCTGISLIKNGIEKLPDYELETPLLDIFLIKKIVCQQVPLDEIRVDANMLS
ncbi:NB-ARC domains-containing protein [Tanacetum coccineum]